MFPACQLTDAPDGAVDSSQPGAIALAPDQAFMVGRYYFPSTLNQGAVSIEEQLGIVKRADVPLVDANRHHHPDLPAGFANGLGGGRWYRHRLMQQPFIFYAYPYFVRRLDKGKIGVVRHHRLWEGSKLHALATQLNDLLDNLVHSPFAAVKNRAELYGGGFDGGHSGNGLFIG